MTGKKTQEKLKVIVKSLPSTSGVYKFIGKDRVLYVGKAKNLKNRVKTYFRKDDKRSNRLLSLIEHIDDIEYIEVDTELEAFILETNLIKELMPKYNVLMKDGKSYSYIKITRNEDYPRIEIVRKMEKDGAKYFGPKTSTTKVRDTIDLLHKLFRFRNCKLNIKYENGKNKDGDYNVCVTKKTMHFPCMEYHIKRCDAPCIGKISPDEYKKNIYEVIAFLEGKHRKVISQLKERMTQAVLEKNFEYAAKLRDKLLSVEKVQEKQKISEATLDSRDLISFVIKGDKAFFNMFIVREGKLINQENFVLDTHLKGLVDPNDNDLCIEILERFMKDYYDNTPDIPSEILISHEGIDLDFMLDWLSLEAGHVVKIIIPKKGKKSKLLELSNKNAESYAAQCQVKWDTEIARTTGAAAGLAKALNIKTTLKRIECYDISHFSGSNTVASMVVFENGRPKKSDYRHFKMKTLTNHKIDDFKSMEEVLSRRLKYLIKEEKVEKLRISRVVNEKEEEILYNIIVNKEKVGGAKLNKIGRHYIFHQLLLDIKYESVFNKLFEKVLKDCDAPKLYFITSNVEKYLEKSFNRIKVYPKEIKPFIKKGKEVLSFSKSKVSKFDKSFSSFPDLIVIDGGKGQLSSVMKVVKKLKIDVNVCSLAKKQEDIYLPSQSTPIVLAKDSQSQYLVQRIRDEAHRFAITHNRNCRDKEMLKS